MTPTNPITEAREALHYMANNGPYLPSRVMKITAALDYAETQACLVTECAEYLKDDQTPSQRMEQDHKDILALMELLHDEKVKTETQAAEIERLNLRLEQAEDRAHSAEEALFEVRQERDALKAKLAKAEEVITRIAANKHQSISLMSMPPIDQRAQWALDYLSQFTKGEEG